MEKYMKKVFILVYLSSFIILQSSNKDEIYNEIKSNAEKSKEGEISSILKKSGVKDRIERILILNEYKDRAWEDNDPKYRDRLHAEILYEKQENSSDTGSFIWMAIALYLICEKFS